jgi:phosphonoacetaldehyde hydrolase
MTVNSKPIIPMVIFDWAGTVVDHGSIAPVKALEDIFAAEGMDAPRRLVRKYMGLAKRDHVRAMLHEPEIAAQLARLHARRVTEEDVDRLYARFEPQMMALLPGYAEVIAGAVDTAEELRSRGIRIGGTTGYTRPMLDELMELAARQGYRTDASLCPEDVGAGRPHPWMCYRLAIDLRVYPLSRCVKVGDTPSDMEEGRNAGMWAIGLTRSGNAVGLTEAEWRGLDAAEKKRLLGVAERELVGAGAHFTAGSVAQILPVLDEIEGRIRAGELPR